MNLLRRHLTHWVESPGRAVRRAAPALLGAVAILVVATGCGQADPHWSEGGRRVYKPPADGLDSLRDAIKRAESNKDPAAAQAKAEAHVRLGREYLNRQRLREAWLEFHAAWLDDNQNTEAFLGMAQLDAILNVPKEILALADGAVKLNPQDPSNIPIIQEAADTLDHLLKRHPNQSWILLYAAYLQAQLKHWDQAEDYCRRASESSAPPHPPPHLLMARLYWQNGMIEDTVRELQLVFHQQPDNALAHFYMGRVGLYRGELPQALASFKEAQRLRPEWMQATLQVGFSYMALRQYDNAIAQFDQVLQQVDRDEFAQMWRAECFMHQGKDAQALAAYEKMLQDWPDDVVALNNLASLYVKTDANLDRALNTAQRAVLAGPNNGDVKDTYGWILYRAGRAEDAVVNLRQAVQLAAGNALYRYHLGKALLAANHRTEAVEYLRAALSQGLPPDESRDAQATLAAPAQQGLVPERKEQ